MPLVETDDPISTSPISSLINTGSSTTLETQTPIPSSDPSSKSKVKAGAIAGGVAGGVAALTVLILLLLLFWRWRKRSQKSGYFIHEESGSGDRTPSIVPFPLDAMPLTEVPSHDYSKPHNDSSPSITTYPRSPASSSSEKRRFESMSSQTNRTTMNSSSLSPNPMPLRNHGHISSASGSPLLPELDFATLDSAREAVREQRQQEIDQRLHDVKIEMHQLNTQKSSRELSSDLSPREIVEMRQQMREMREQIEYFQAQQQSEWAQGLSDEPPPGYSAQSPSL
ncbi:hypothetical protein H0H81_012477 [Sphagnurus paluster]|uniref:Uncharacterized protein n=1 Tax=Sphagnurus paluster TaxID=117069 RepID=A0A9P7KNH0_9AGAR|nr:hypothetical protein H0H81_012477 [Sphagnurus paluster]